MTLEVSLRVDERDVSLDLAVPAGETIAVIGENGSGKTTLVEAIAGLVVPDRGSIVLDERVLFETGRGAGGTKRTWVPAHRRGIALLAQDPMLFPHLTALENVAFGPRSAGMSRRRARDLASATLESVDAGDLAGRRPHQLSGGQAQRVALARALAVEPRLLLLDEPLAAVDVAARDEIRRMLRGVLAGRSAVIVTHDVADAAQLAQRVVVLAGGRVVEQGAVQQVLSCPRTPFTARLVGLNLVRGGMRDGAFVSDAGLVLPVEAGRGPVKAGLVLPAEPGPASAPSSSEHVSQDATRSGHESHRLRHASDARPGTRETDAAGVASSGTRSSSGTATESGGGGGTGSGTGGGSGADRATGDGGGAGMLAAFPPSAVRLRHAAPGERQFPIDAVEAVGATTRLTVAAAIAEVPAVVAASFAPGDSVSVAVAPDAVRVYPAVMPSRTEPGR